MKKPWFSFYPGDWLSDPKVNLLTPEAEGLYIRLLCFAHQSEKRGFLILNGVILDEKKIKKIAKKDQKNFKKVFKELIVFGLFLVDEKTGAYYNPRMVRDAELERVRAECGKLGGNPLLVNRSLSKSLTTEVNQKQTPSEPEPEPYDPPPTPPPGGGVCVEKKIESGGFERFWAVYPRKAGRDEAERQWRRLKLDEQSDEIVAAVEVYAKTDKCKRGFILDPARFLKEKRWRDEMETVANTGKQAARDKTVMAAILNGERVYSPALGMNADGCRLCPGNDRVALPDGRDFPISFFEVIRE